MSDQTVEQTPPQKPRQTPSKTPPAPKRKVSWLALSPLLVFLALGGVFGYQLLFGNPADRKSVV